MIIEVAPQQTAHDAYAAHVEQIHSQLCALQRAYDALLAKAESQSLHWGHVGDVVCIEARLAEVLNAIQAPGQIIEGT